MGGVQFVPPQPIPFQFEERGKQRQRQIMEVKTHQDVAIKRMERDAARQVRFKANTIPRSTSTPRWGNQLSHPVELKALFSRSKSAYAKIALCLVSHLSHMLRIWEVTISWKLTVKSQCTISSTISTSFK